MPDHAKAVTQKKCKNHFKGSEIMLGYIDFCVTFVITFVLTCIQSENRVTVLQKYSVRLM